MGWIAGFEPVTPRATIINISFGYPLRRSGLARHSSVFAPGFCPREDFIYGRSELLRLILRHVRIYLQGHGYILMPGQILYFFNIHSGGAQVCYIRVPELVRRNVKVKLSYRSPHSAKCHKAHRPVALYSRTHKPYVLMRRF